MVVVAYSGAVPSSPLPAPLCQRATPISKKNVGTRKWNRAVHNSATRSDENGASSWRNQQQLASNRGGVKGKNESTQESTRLGNSSSQLGSSSSFVSSNSTELSPAQGSCGNEHGTWEWWTAYFNEMDDAVRELEGVEMELANAIDAEDYGEAARLCEHKRRLESGDCVTAGLRDLAVAVEEERYGDAAALRDGLGASIVGWWVGQGQGQDGQDGQEKDAEDAYGHLLHVSPDFGRYVGHAFSGTHLAEMVQAAAAGGSTTLIKRNTGFSSKISFVVTSDTEDDSGDGESGHDGLGGAGGWDSQDEEIDLSKEEYGIPLFELFVRKIGTGYEQQAAALQTPSPTNLLESSSVAVIDDVTELLSKELGNGKQVSFERGKKENGVDYIRINVQSTEEDSSEAGEDMKDAEEDEDIDDKEIMQVTDLLDDDDDEHIDNQQNTLSEMGLGVIASRVPATVSWQDRDTFELFVPESGEGEQQLEEDEEQNQGESIILKDELSSSGALSGRFREEIESMVKDAMTVAVAQGIGAVGGAGFKGSVKYRRLHAHDIRPSTDPFSGIYVGSFGPHGPEAVLVKRRVIDGEEWAVATKLTGDPNVPAGKVTFRARIGREHRLSSAGTYAPEFSVQQRYKGQGKVAREGYSNAKWVDGELLTFSAANPITRGAELGFVYEVDSQHKFVLLFTKVDLEKLVAQTDN